MADHYDQREALYALYAKKAFPDPVSPLTSRQRVSDAFKQFADANMQFLWHPIDAYSGCSQALVTAKNEYGAFRSPISAYRDAAGVWRLLGSKGGMARLGFSPTYFMDLPNPPLSKAQKDRADE